MVWKSERWQSKLNAEAPSEDGALDEDCALLPQTLEITYVSRDGCSEEQEVVYEDSAESGSFTRSSRTRSAGLSPSAVHSWSGSPPRLLVSLQAVTALKDLCEHEHAKYDQILKTLQTCRSTYYKELRWLRDQLHLAYRTDQEAIDYRSQLKRDDFEVYWFEPPNYIDEESADFMKHCIRETNRMLIDEMIGLKNQLAQYEVMENGSMKAVLRHLRKENTPSAILRELYDLLRSKEDIRDFEDGAVKILQAAGIELQAVGGAPNTDALQEELEELRRKSKEDQASLTELRSRLSSGVDAELERQRANAEKDRADAERQRADMVQQRAERLERQLNQLRSELQRDTFDPERQSRLQKSIQKLGEAYNTLTPKNSSSSTPLVSPSKPIFFAMGSPKSVRNSTTTGRGNMALSPGGQFDELSATPATSFDGALVCLDEVANGFDAIAHGVLAEMQQLRARLAQFEAAANAPKESDEERAVSRQSRRPEIQVDSPSAAPSRRSNERSEAAAAEAAEAAEAAAAAAAAALARVAELEREVEELRSLLMRECENSKALKADLEEHRRLLDESKNVISELEKQVFRLQSKVEKMKQAIEDLKAGRPVTEDFDDDDDELEGMEINFLTPYRKRVALAAANKPRWQLLSEDARYVRAKREYILGQKHHVYERQGVEIGEVADVAAAFQFLARQTNKIQRGSRAAPPAPASLPTNLAAPVSRNVGRELLQAEQASHPHAVAAAANLLAATVNTLNIGRAQNVAAPGNLQSGSLLAEIAAIAGTGDLVLTPPRATHSAPTPQRPHTSANPIAASPDHSLPRSRELLVGSSSASRRLVHGSPVISRSPMISRAASHASSGRPGSGSLAATAAFGGADFPGSMTSAPGSAVLARVPDIASPVPPRRAVNLGMQRRPSVPLTNAPRQQSKNGSDLKPMTSSPLRLLHCASSPEVSSVQTISTDVCPAFPGARLKRAVPATGGGA